MNGVAQKIYMLDENGLRDAVEESNALHQLTPNCSEWFNPDEAIDLFWDYSEYGCNCIMVLDISGTAMIQEQNFLLESEDMHASDVDHWRVRYRILKHLRDRVPIAYDKVYIPISY